MSDGLKRLAPYVPAALLACLVLRVFYELQDYGPESAIRRFNEAVKKGNVQELRTLMLDGPNSIQSKDVQAFIQDIAYAWSHGATMQIVRLDRTGNEVRAISMFSPPQGNPQPVIWVVERRGVLWLIDARKTATILGDQVGQ